MDGEVVELGAPLPGLAQRATVRFDGDGGELVVVGPDGREERRHLDRPAVDAWLAEARAFQARVAAKRAGNEVEHAESAALAASRPERSASTRPTCGHCGIAREHRGLWHLVASGQPGQIARAEVGYWRPETHPVHVYACPRCGSLEWFAPGLLDHPLGG